MRGWLPAVAAALKVHAASVNPVDWNVRQGHMQQFLPLKLPAALGWDLSGVPEEAYRQGGEQGDFRRAPQQLCNGGHSLTLFRAIHALALTQRFTPVTIWPAVRVVP